MGSFLVSVSLVTRVLCVKLPSTVAKLIFVTMGGVSTKSKDFDAFAWQALQENDAMLETPALRNLV